MIILFDRHFRDFRLKLFHNRPYVRLKKDEIRQICGLFTYICFLARMLWYNKRYLLTRDYGITQEVAKFSVEPRPKKCISARTRMVLTGQISSDISLQTEIDLSKMTKFNNECSSTSRQNLQLVQDSAEEQLQLFLNICMYVPDISTKLRDICSLHSFRRYSI